MRTVEAHFPEVAFIIVCDENRREVPELEHFASRIESQSSLDGLRLVDAAG
ncbi:hypothetical protein [Enterococcus sp. BWR-S5]|uniref:hypothetical protein n=1 Tax=Enterococcus sp. BWR-S5 TaxID=2787714 RepID=UPI0019230031|nr:hypothetical protein [Enterococcus sp. BWR-S5]MBL1223886.1 hypothetical protein [Enterococcus sp. BWR-S5]